MRVVRFPPGEFASLTFSSPQRVEGVAAKKRHSVAKSRSTISAARAGVQLLLVDILVLDYCNIIVSRSSNVMCSPMLLEAN